SDTPSSSTCVALRRPWESLASSKMTTSPTLGFRVAFLTLEMWKKTCSLLPSGLMKPKPLSSFHETIFPFILVELSFLMAYLTPHITGSKKQSEERAVLFAVRVHVIVRR